MDMWGFPMYLSTFLYIILSTFVFKIFHNKKFKNTHLEM